MFSSRTLLLLSVASLLAGSLFYLLFRPEILLFAWLPEMKPLRPPGLLYQFSGYFSDLAWVVSICICVVFLNRKNFRHSSSILLPVPFVTEIAQHYALLPGTFDWSDILVYAVVIILFSLLYPAQFINMKKLKSILVPSSVASLFIMMTLACATTPPPKYKPAPCITHKGLTYAPVLTKINLSGSYTMKDLSGAQRIGYEIIMDELRSLNPGKYQLADGVTPNLTIDIVINTDSYQHYGATLNMYVFDGSVYYSWPANYVTVEKLFTDITAKVNSFVSYGWCTNCPSPCNP